MSGDTVADTAPVTDAELLRVIETGFWTLPSVPGRSDPIRIPGVIGKVANVPHPAVNMVGMADLPEADVDRTIQAVLDVYAGNGCLWVVGPSSMPPDLPERLRAFGFAPALDLSGMALTDIDSPIPVNPDVTVRPMQRDDRAAALPMMAAAYGLPIEVIELLQSSTETDDGGPWRFTMYLASVGDDPTPVGFGAVGISAGSSVCLLCGAATLPEHRGKGVYTALVARRLADARVAGCHAAAIEAMRSTSAPICARLGFREICGLIGYVRMPSAS